MGEEESRIEKRAELMKKPWFQEAYKAACKFYEKDEQLDANDRLELSKNFQAVTRAQFAGGWLGFTAVFLTPFAYRYYKTNSIKGVRVPRNFVLALVGMFATTRIAGGYTYSSKLSALDPDGSLASRSTYGDQDPATLAESKTAPQRQWEMMKLLPGGFAARWAAYFYLTHQNPARRFPNPEKLLEEFKKGDLKPSSFWKQRDPFGLYSGSGKKEDWRVFRPWGKIEDSVTDSTGNTKTWEDIRQSNSAAGSKDQGISQPSQSEFDSLLENERNGKDGR